MTAQCSPYMAALKIFGTPYAHGYFPQNFSWAFVLIHAMNVHTQFKVCIPDPEILGGTPKIWAVRGYAHTSSSQKFLMGFSLNAPYECTCHIKIRSFTCS